MAFRVPNFNLSVNIWRSTNPVTNPPDVGSVGNLSPGKRVMHLPPSFSAATVTALSGWHTGLGLAMELLLPAGTDIRYDDSPNPGVFNMDAVEVPAGSGRYYLCLGVDDVAKGFANEYRLAVLAPATSLLRSATSNPWSLPAVTFPIP